MTTRYYRVEIRQPAGPPLKEALKLARQLGGEPVGRFSAGALDGREIQEYSFSSYKSREEFIRTIKTLPSTSVRRARTAPTHSEPVERKVLSPPQKLYHVTPRERSRSILKYGLHPGGVPALGAWRPSLAGPDDPLSHRRRIYLTDSPDIFEDLEDEAFSSGTTVLEVTLPPQSTVYHGSIYEDPIPTYYVKRPIPPKFLRVLRQSV